MKTVTQVAFLPPDCQSVHIAVFVLAIDVRIAILLLPLFGEVLHIFIQSPITVPMKPHDPPPPPHPMHSTTITESPHEHW